MFWDGDENCQWTTMGHANCLWGVLTLSFMSHSLVPGSGSSCIKDASGDTNPPASPVLVASCTSSHPIPILLRSLLMTPVLTWASRPSPETIGFPMLSLSWDPVAKFMLKLQLELYCDYIVYYVIILKLSSKYCIKYFVIFRSEFVSQMNERTQC